MVRLFVYFLPWETNITNILVYIDLFNNIVYIYIYYQSFFFYKLLIHKVNKVW